jgi:multiple sugar transport system substrate-binding protein
MWSDEATIREMIKEYEQKNQGVSITYEVKDARDSYRQRLFALAEKNKAPDIFRFHNTWVPSMGTLLGSAPNDIFPPETFKSEYYPVVSKDLIVNNAVVGVPLGIDGIVLLYNKKLLTDGGVSSVPTDWESLVDVAKKLTVKNTQNQIEFSGIAMGTAENVEHFSDVIAGMFMQNEVTLTNIAGNQNAVSVLEAYTAFATPPNDTWNETMPSSVVAFTNEKVAMILAPYWHIETIRQLNPDLQLGVSVFPQIRGGTKKAPATYWVEGVWSKSPNSAEAWKFLKYLSSKESLEKMQTLDMKSGRALPTRPYPRVDMASLIIQDPFQGPVVQQAPDYSSLPLIQRTYDGGTSGQGGLNDSLNAYLKDAVNSIILGGSPGAAVDTFAQGVAQVMEQFTPPQQ